MPGGKTSWIRLKRRVLNVSIHASDLSLLPMTADLVWLIELLEQWCWLPLWSPEKLPKKHIQPVAIGSSFAMPANTLAEWHDSWFRVHLKPEAAQHLLLATSSLHLHNLFQRLKRLQHQCRELWAVDSNQLGLMHRAWRCVVAQKRLLVFKTTQGCFWEEYIFSQGVQIWWMSKPQKSRGRLQGSLGVFGKSAPKV